MDLKDFFIFYDNFFNSIDKTHITTKSKNKLGLYSGVKGEETIYKLLRRYTNEIYREVVIWNKKHTLTTEIDFLCIINGYLIVVEVKEWYGTIEPTNDPNKVILSQLNSNGLFFKHYRFNPVAGIGAFTSDLFTWLKPNPPKKYEQMKRFVVFTRDDLMIKQSLSTAVVEVCHIGEFELILDLISKEKNFNPYHLEKEMPSWDYYYSGEESTWYKFVVLNKTINDIPVSNIDSIVFNDDGSSLVRLRDGFIVEAIIDMNDISVFSMFKTIDKAAVFIQFDMNLHKDSTPVG